VVEHPTHQQKIKGSNPATFVWRKKMEKKVKRGNPKSYNQNFLVLSKTSSRPSFHVSLPLLAAMAGLEPSTLG
jgi:hypothetical protein